MVPVHALHGRVYEIAHGLFVASQLQQFHDVHGCTCFGPSGDECTQQLLHICVWWSRSSVGPMNSDRPQWGQAGFAACAFRRFSISFDSAPITSSNLVLTRKPNSWHATLRMLRPELCFMPVASKRTACLSVMRSAVSICCVFMAKPQSCGEHDRLRGTGQAR